MRYAVKLSQSTVFIGRNWIRGFIIVEKVLNVIRRNLRETHEELLLGDTWKRRRRKSRDSWTEVSWLPIRVTY